jgi:hypothetical protein
MKTLRRIGTALGLIIGFRAAETFWNNGNYLKQVFQRPPAFEAWFPVMAFFGVTIILFTAAGKVRKGGRIAAIVLLLWNGADIISRFIHYSVYPQLNKQTPADQITIATIVTIIGSTFILIVFGLSVWATVLTFQLNPFSWARFNIISKEHRKRSRPTTLPDVNLSQHHVRRHG